MSFTYKIQKGDTIERISRRFFGSEVNANEILNANPDISDDLIIGSDIIIPDLANKPQDRLFNVTSNNINEVSLLINNVRFRFWDTIRINRNIDSIDTIEFTAPFDANDQNFRRLFKPFSFQSVSVFVGSEILFKGTLISVNTDITETTKTLSVGCYSLPGVLNDCTAPASSYPLEYNNLGLRDIAQYIVSPFGISVEFLSDQGAVFERVACDVDRSILDFLSDLAKQRNLIISNSKDGKLTFLRGTQSGGAVANLIQGNSPLLSITSFFSEQDYYSHVTGIEPVVTGTQGSQYTVKNSRLNNVVRPLTFTAQDTIEGNIQQAVEAKISRMFGNMVSYELIVDTWQDSQGNLWEPNTNIFINAPDVMIYSKYEFTIRSIKFEREANQEKATLNVVLVGSFSGNIPSFLPWD